VLESILQSWSQTLQKLGRTYEILLIDDGSTDASVSLLEGSEGKAGLFKRIPHLHLKRHPIRRGYGGCIRTALEYARHSLFFYTGCDHPYQPADLKAMLTNIEETDPESGRKVEIVNGFRATTPLPNWRRIMGVCYRGFLRVALGATSDPLPGWLDPESRALARKMRILFGVRLHDINSRFKLFRKQLLERFPIQSDGDFVHGEILAKANFLGSIMMELPIAQRPGPIPVSPEPPPPTDLGTDLRTVFRNPKFISSKAEPAPAV
jgi:glycosyltransferase involved in cell wall biosynthesis